MHDYVINALRERYDPDELPPDYQVDTVAGRAAADRRKVLEVCTFMDPRFCNQLKDEEVASARERVIAEILEQDDRISAAASTSNAAGAGTPTPAPPPTGFAAIFAKRRKAGSDAAPAALTPRQRVAREIDRYVSAPKPGIETDPLLWWQRNSADFPELCDIAKKYLAIQGSCITSERYFHKAGCVVRPTRTNLSD